MTRLVFVVKEASALDRVRGELLSGAPGAAFRDEYLAPLKLERGDVDVALADVCAGRTVSQTDCMWIALGRDAAEVAGCDFRLPHPAAVARLGVPKSLVRKLRAIRKALTSLDNTGPTKVGCETSADSQVDKLVPIIKGAGDERQIIYGVVLDPYEIDAHNDWTPPSQVEVTAHRWFAESRTIGLNHAGPANAQAVESWIVPYPPGEYAKAMRGEEHRAYLMPFGDSKVRSGSWILGTKLGAAEWQLYKAGEIDAYSIGALGQRIPIDAPATMPKVLWIDLMPSEPSEATNTAPPVPNP